MIGQCLRRNLFTKVSVCGVAVCAMLENLPDKSFSHDAGKDRDICFADADARLPLLHTPPRAESINQAIMQRMKARPLILFCVSAALWCAQDNATAAEFSPQSPVIIDTGPNHRSWESTRLVTDEFGQSTLRPSTFVEVAPGLNYQDESGIWRASEDLIELTDDGGAAALRGQHKVRFSPNINTQGAITLTTVSNRVFRSHPVGLYYFSAETGQSALIARVKDSTAELHPPNQLVWPDCLEGEGVRADYRVTYTKAGLEADLILHQLPAPEAFGLNPAAARLEWFTEWLDLPVIRKRERVLKRETDPARRATMAEPDLVEEILDCGDLLFPTGRGFALDGGTESRPSDVAATISLGSSREADGLVVAKRLLEIDQRTVLVEALDWRDLEPKLAALAVKTGVRRARNDAVRGRRLPGTRVAQAMLPPKTVQIARAAYVPRGFVLDYVAVGSSGDFTFASGVTYLAGGFFNGTVTFQPGCIVKLSSGGGLSVYGSLVCNGNGSSYSILTSKNEDLYGEPIPGSTGNPTYTASAALEIYYPDTDMTASYLNIRWAQTGVLYSYGTATSHTLNSIRFEKCQVGVDVRASVVSISSSQFENSDTGLSVNDSTVSLSNVTKCNVTTEYVYSGTFTVNGSMSTSTDCQADTDEDGLPDSWEVSNFGNLNQTGTWDYDGDGLTNLQEYQLGTNPTSANVDSDDDGLADGYDPNRTSANGAPTIGGQTIYYCPQ
jgi:thrombospondin type 3 repeat protein